MNKFQVMHQISELLLQATDPWKGLANAAKLLAKQTGSMACALYALNEQRTALILVAQHGLDANKYPEGHRVSLDQGSISIVIHSRQTVNLADQRHQSQPMYDAPLHSQLIVPLVVGGQIIGMVDFLREAARRYPVQTVELANEIVMPLGMYIIHAMMTSREEKRAGVFLNAAKEETPLQQAYHAQTIRGRFLSPGTASGRVVKLSCVEDLLVVRRIPSPVHTTLAEIEMEKQKLFRALKATKLICERSVKELAEVLSEADTSIFSMHAMMVDDPTLKQMLLKSIEEGHSITTALGLALRSFTTQYGKIEDTYLRERLYDIKDVLLSIKNAADNLSNLSENENVILNPNMQNARHLILVTRELLPSQLIAQPLKKICGIISEEGGATSHVAILARALQIPMLVDVPGLADVVAPGDPILMDCSEMSNYEGKCYLKPSMEITRRFAAQIRMTRDQQSFRWSPGNVRSADSEAVLKDGTPLRFAANLSLLNELPVMRYYGVREVGLYRTEFLFMIRERMPDEDTQFAIFRQILENAKGAPVTLRVLDIGADKALSYLDFPHEDNPAMGLRGFRYLLKYKEEILMPHLCALLRASAYGNMRILFPMIADRLDVVNARMLWEEAQKRLTERGEKFASDIPFGVMLEIPSACIAAETLLPLVDFFSVGTNDLLQFLFAVDRGNPHVAKWYKRCHPTLLRLLRDVCRKVAACPGKSLTVCGELGGSITALPLLIGCGVRGFSMTPSRVPILRELVKKHTVARCEVLLDEVLQCCTTDMEVQEYLRTHGREESDTERKGEEQL